MYGGENLLDGNDDTEYASEYTDNPKWIKINLEGAYSLTKIEITHTLSKLYMVTHSF